MEDYVASWKRVDDDVFPGRAEKWQTCDVLPWTTYPNDCHTQGHGTLNGNQSGTW